MTAAVVVLAVVLLAVVTGGAWALRRVLGVLDRPTVDLADGSAPVAEAASMLLAVPPAGTGEPGLRSESAFDPAAEAETLAQERAALAREHADLTVRQAETTAALADVERARVSLAHDDDAIVLARGDLERARAELDEARAGLETAQVTLERDRAASAAERASADAERAALRRDRERLAGISAAEARAELMAEQLDGARRDAALDARRIEADALATAEARAREVVAQSVQRLATASTTELTVLTLRLPADDYKGRIIGREGRNIRAFETVTGVDVLVDETPDIVQLSCFDPVRREIGRLTMEALLADGRIHPQRIEDLHASAAAEVEQVCRRAAEDAVLSAGIGPVDEVLLGHLGALRFRTSYGQNVLAHLVESAGIAATMAAEIGADVALVKRCAFLHDIGKALTHEVEGSHALVGADLARRHGESAAVVHAIEAHHNEVTPLTVEAVLTQASDACSGGRPGARRESAAAYTARLQRIEEIAASQPGVERVFAVQAGHEVRVMVQPDEVDDLAAGQIARTVAKQIEQELTYPGQVRVTVIRESRVSEVAH